MKKKIAGAALLAVLAACGGGGGDDGAVLTANSQALLPSAQGLWQGRTSTGLNANVAVLENGEMWGVYGLDAVIYGAVYGTTRWTGGQIAGDGTAFDTNGGALLPTTFSGNFAPGTSIAVSTPEGVQFSAVYHPGYDQPASQEDLAGSFRGRAVSPSAPARLAGLAITATGAVTVADAVCPGSGTVQPRATGKNIYDLELTFRGSTCFLGDGTTVRGVAYYDSGTKQLLAMGLNAQRTDGFIYLGIK